MEEAVKPHNKGVLPADLTPVLSEYRSPETDPRRDPEKIANDFMVEIDPEKPVRAVISTEPSAEYPRAYSHVRSPELRRGEYIILMSATAVCGTVGGVILALSGKADTSAIVKITEDLSSGFGSIFFQRLLIGAAFLLAEYLLGFFALGDLFSWAAPMCCAMGLSLRISATESWILLPSAVVTLIACVMGAATSSGLSRTLMRISRGGTVHLEDSLHLKYTVSFLGYLTAVIAGAIYEGAILN